METKTYRYEQVEYLFSPHAHFELSQKTSSFVPFHYHDALELIYILEGELVVIQGQHETLFRPGDIALINLNVLHSTISRTGNTSILLQFPSADLYHYIPDMRYKEFLWEPFSSDSETRRKMDGVRGLLDSLLDTAKDQPPGHILHFESLLLELIFQLYSGFAHDITKAQFHLSEKNLERLSQIVSFTEEHYAESFSLSDIAGHFHLQTNYFCRFFKNNTGVTYMKFLQDYRLSKIYYDLLHSDLPLGLLLERHGFTNYKLFRQCFYERFGMTPGALRRAKKE
ncbi:MAG: AraC family transcriptional regulator [Eubacteriales bacterium]|nr:AraC family transcriptional regulator [Eubacteriales bacterium]